MSTFFWHDYETFGLSPAFDRPAQFAGLRTDAELNPIGDAVMWYCQPALDYLPDPQSCLLTGITPQRCWREGLPEREFAARIHAELAREDTVGVGYNSLRFDDEVTRHLFWRNLIEPYGREWQNGCGRWDLLDVMRAAHALRPEGLNWPQREGGGTSFRLEDLTRANGLDHGQAHDALSDVQATVALARLLRQAQPRLFDFFAGLRRKEAVIEQIQTVAAGGPFWHVSGRLSAAQGHMALVYPLAPHPTNKNELIVWDLAQDPAELGELRAADIRARLFVRSEDLPEGVQRLPIKTLHLNRSPIVVGNLKVLTAERAAHWGIDVAQRLRHAEAAARVAPLLAGLWPEVYARERDAGPVDVDGDLYGGFLSRADRSLLDSLRALEPAKMAAQMGAQMAQRQPAFEDERLDELLLRYIGRHEASVLGGEALARWQAHGRQRLWGEEGREGSGPAPRTLTLAAYARRIDELAESAFEKDDERAQTLLEELADYASAVEQAWDEGRSGWWPQG
ncbi:exodeoxyribonuclease I [Amphibiibacter pelophylacis]|uniref:Exodeoxyribonuclease I n=1 Tax=Amphibiibacter pelophylacis TaxID=1799477 RepID=A0ACC6P4P7_9BURK